MKNQKIMVAVLAGIAAGLAAPAAAHAQDAQAPVKCFGVNGCGQHASCAVKQDDIAAVRALLGPKAFKAKFGKTAEHSCKAHASCGAGSGVLNFTDVSVDSCTQQGGIVIEEKDGKKIAKKLS